MRYITIALAKGRLAKKALEIFEHIGVTCDEMKDENTRKLIFTNEELGIRFFLAKPSDVPTYVEYGAADIGIVGKDTLLEEGRSLYEVYDLKIGQCKMCVCGPASAREKLQHHELISVAPVSTISTITSESPTIGASSTEPLSFMISTVWCFLL